jgi:hypothetical protein
VPANIHHGESVDAEPVVLAIVTTETIIRDPVAVVTAALLPGVVLGLPTTRAITLPSGLLYAYLSGAPLLRRPVVLLLAPLALLILLHDGLLLALLILLSPGLLLSLLILLPVDLLLVFGGVVLLLTLLALLILLSSGLLLSLLILLPIGLLLLFRGVVLLLTLLPLLILLPLSLLLLLGLSLLLFFRLCLLLLFRGLSLLILFLLPCVSRSSDSEQQKKRCRSNNSDWFHGVTSMHPLTRPSIVIRSASLSGLYYLSVCI